MLSIVMCSRDDQRFAAGEAGYAKAMGSAQYEIIRIPDARSMSEGYNRGYLEARGDQILFSHDDAFFLSGGLAEKLAHHFERFDVFGVIGSTEMAGPVIHAAGPPYLYGQIATIQPPRGLRVCIINAAAPAVPGMKLLDGVLIGATRAAVERLDGWDETFRGFHGYDVDFSFRAHLAGLRVGCACDLDVLHTADSSYDTPEWREAAMRFIAVHKAHLLAAPPDMKWHSAEMWPKDEAHAARLMRPPHWETLRLATDR